MSADDYIRIGNHVKLFNIIFTLLFVVSAALQYNDPDPFLWVPIYLSGAWCAAQAARGMFYPRIYLLLSAVFIIYGIALFFDKYGVLTWMTEHHAENIATSMKASTPWIEETREFFGLAILITVLMINYWVSLRTSLTTKK